MSFGYNTIMVAIDRLSKFAHFIPLKKDYTSKSIVEIFMNQVVISHGLPKSIVFDKDDTFTSNFWNSLFKLQGTTLAMSTTYHQQYDAQSEVLNKCLEMFLRCFTFQNLNLWFKALTWAEYWYNTSHHSSIGWLPSRLHMEDAHQLWLDTLPCPQTFL